MTYLDRAIEIARGVEEHSSPYRIGAVVTDRKGNIISTGWNVRGKTHPTQKKFMDMAKETNKEFLHAEIHALVRTYKGTPHAIYIARVNSSGIVGLAKPCKICAIAIAEAGITNNNIFYTE